jgi:chemotaxis protein MotB
MKKTLLSEEPANHDRWLVSYSDLITVLFALFVVLFASSYRDNQVVRNLSTAIHIGFQELGAFPGEKVPERQSNSNQHTEAPAGPQPVPGATTGKSTQSTTPPVDFAELKQQLSAAASDEIRNHEVVMRVTPEGFVISLNDVGFFSSGQAVLMPGAAGKIRRIATVLVEHGLDLRVEGHSDNQPIHTAQFRSNWELSTARAMAVLMLLVNDSGIDPRKVSIAGYGQYRPVADNSTPQGRQMNRRVDIVVVASPAAPQPVP